MRVASYCCVIFFLLAASFAAHAHKPSDSYLAISVDRTPNVKVQWDIALRDLELPLRLDANDDGVITWGELRSRQSAIFDYALRHISIEGDSTTCAPELPMLLVDEHTDGTYAVLRFEVRCAARPEKLAIGYHLLFDIDPSHRGLLRIDAGGTSRSAVLSPQESVQSFTLSDTSRWRTFVEFVADGIHHIWIGYDHILFLVSLLLPSVLRRENGRWLPVRRLRPALLSVLTVVTAFTVSHSITLTLAALGIIGLPSRIVESGIALSVALAALNNVWPVVSRRLWLLALGFGLVHGLGFASVLADLGLPRDALALSLAGFNIGVEIGQLSIVLLVVPLIFLMRERSYYRPAVLVGGSACIAVLATAWLASRVFDLGLG